MVEATMAVWELVKQGDVGGLAQLMAADPAVVMASNEFGWKPLHFSAMHNQAAVAAALLAHGAHIEAQTEAAGNTALHRAALAGNPQVMAVLIEGGADVDAKNKMEQTALSLVAHGRSCEAARLLIKHGATIDSRTKLGWTPLHQAACYGVRDIMEVLLEAGANPGILSADGRTPQDVAKPCVRDMFSAVSRDQSRKSSFNCQIPEATDQLLVSTGDGAMSPTPGSPTTGAQNQELLCC